MELVLTGGTAAGRETVSDLFRDCLVAEMITEIVEIENRLGDFVHVSMLAHCLLCNMLFSSLGFRNVAGALILY